VVKTGGAAVRSNLPNRLLPLVKDPSPRYVLAVGGRWKMFVIRTRESYFDEAYSICGSSTNLEWSRGLELTPTLK